MTTDFLTTIDYETFHVRPMTEADIVAAGTIVYAAFNTFNAQAGLPPEWPDEAFTTSLAHLFFNNPAYGKIVAIDNTTQQVTGVNFFDIGDDIIAIGPVAVATQHQHQGVGRALMEYCINLGNQLSKPDLRLVQIANNVQSFALYASLGFQCAETLTMLAGRATQSTEADQAYTIRPLTESDIDACNLLHKQATGISRAADITRAVFAGSAMQPFVAIHHDQIAAYTTSFSLSGHCVASSPAAFKALYSHVSQLVDYPLIHLPARLYPELLTWSITSAKLQVVRQELLMYRGAYSTPPAEFVYTSSIVY